MCRAAVVARVAEEYENETEAIVSGMGGRRRLAVCAFVDTVAPCDSMTCSLKYIHVR
jgi:hypothetical protein